MSLFATLYLDEDVSVLVARLLCARGFDVVTAVEAGMLGRDDLSQLTQAAARTHCLVTHNRVHFEMLHRQFLDSGRGHWGVIVAARRNPYDLVLRLSTLLDSLTADELRNQLLYV